MTHVVVALIKRVLATNVETKLFWFSRNTRHYTVSKFTPQKEPEKMSSPKKNWADNISTARRDLYT